jgi:hypothetical protein
MRGARLLAVAVVFTIVLNGAATREKLDPLDTELLSLAGSPTVTEARQLDGVIASNGAGALWLLTGKEGRALPRLSNEFTAQPTHDFPEAISRLRDELRGGGYLVWLAAFDYRTYFPSEERTVHELGAVLVERFPEGAIYRVGDG